MADTYTIDGQLYRVIDPQQAAPAPQAAPAAADGQLTPGSPFPSGTSWSPLEALRNIGGAIQAAPEAVAPAASEYAKGLKDNLATLGSGIARGIQALHNKLGTPGFDEDYFNRTFNAYKDNMQYAPEVPDAQHIKSAADAAKWLGHLLGEATPFLAGAFTGGIPAAAGIGALQGGEQAAESPNATDASIATGAGLGAVTSTLPVPLLKSGGGLVKKLLGGGSIGAIQGATQNIPEAVATGNPEDALPSRDQILESVLGNAALMGTVGLAHNAGNAAARSIIPEAAQAPEVSPQQNADRRLTERIQSAVDQNGYNLKNVAYNAGDGAKAALDQVHNGLASDIKFLWSKIAPEMGLPTDLESGLNDSKLTGIIKSAVNKLKGRVGDDDLQFLADRVGNTQEGQHLIDLVRQSNSLTDLFNNGLKGGVSRYTDLLNPLGGDSRENSYVGSVLGGARGPAEMLGYLMHPAAILPGAAAVAGGRAIDAMTGRRSRVARFVDQNSEPAQPLDIGGRPSLLKTQADAAAQAAAFAQAQGAIDLQAEQRQNLAKASAQFDKQQAAAQQSAEQARLAEREQELRTQNRLDNNPGLGGFDRSIYDQTGLLPQDATHGVFELFRTGRITPQEFRGFFKSPRDLMQGNAGNHIMDMLDQMARNGQLERDPDWQATQAASPAVAAPSNIANPLAYAAQAAGNQARVTNAMARVANSGHTPEVKQQINDAAAAIGRTSNRAEAQVIHDNAVQSLAHTPEAQQLAHQELSPLVQQIKHAEAVVDNPKLLGPEFNQILKQAEKRHSDHTDALSEALDQYLERLTNGSSTESAGSKGSESAGGQSGLAKLAKAARSLNGAAAHKP